MLNFFKNNRPAMLGLYGGVILGAVLMMVAGGLGYTVIADLSLILGLCAGPSIGYIIGKIQQKNAVPEEDPVSGKDDEQ